MGSFGTVKALFPREQGLELEPAALLAGEEASFGFTMFEFDGFSSITLSLQGVVARRTFSFFLDRVLQQIFISLNFQRPI